MLNRMNKKYLVLFLLLFLFTIILAACNSSSDATETEDVDTGTVSESNGEPVKGGEINIAYVADVTNFDPIKGTTGNDHSLLWPIYDTLIKFSNEMEPEPGLAESWEVLDESTIELTLRQGVTFHDGTPFNAEAVKFNIERVNSEDSQISDLKSIEEVEIVDEHTVKLHLSAPDASIVLALTDRGGMMVSPAAVEEHGADYSQNPSGAGPFKLANHVPNGEIQYEANTEYWDEGKPYLEKITVKVIPDANSQINALKSGQVDFVPGIQAQMIASLEKDPNVVISNENTLGFGMLYLKTDIEPFNNKAARLAVLHGIDRQQLIDAINFGQGEIAVQPFPEGYWAHNENIDVEFNVEKAKQLLADENLEDVSFTLITYPIEYWTRLANAIKGQLEEVGITVNVETLEANAAVQKFMTDKETHALTGNWSGRPDPQMTINSLYSEDSFYNPGKLSTPNLESLIEEAATTYEQERRIELYGEIVNEAIVNEGFSIPLFTTPATIAMNEKVQGFEPNLLGKPIFSTLWMEEE